MIGIVIIIIALLGIIFLCLSEKIFERTNYYKKNYTETDKLKGDGKVDYVNTGSSFAFYGLDYDVAGVNGLNLALCPQSLEADSWMLKHFEDRYNKGAIVFIVISDLAFAKADYTEATTNDKYYRVLKADEIRGFSHLKAIRAKYLPVLYNWKNFLRFYRDIRPENEYQLKVNENDREAVEADAYKRCQSWIREFALDDLFYAGQSEKFKDAFDYTTDIVNKMASWCRERGLKPILVNLPVTNEMKSCFSKEFLKVFYYDNIKRISKVPFIDLQSNAGLSDYLLYLDSCRLNKVGREIVTKILLREAVKLKESNNMNGAEG